MNGTKNHGKRALVFLVIAVLIAGSVGQWWFGIEQPRREAGRRAAEEATLQKQHWTQLRMVQYVKQPFRLLFSAWDGDFKKNESLAFQITTIDVRQAPQFVKINDVIAGTKFKVVKFEYISKMDFGSFEDVSELTLYNMETGDNVILVLQRIGDFPDSYALFRYLWNNSEFQVKKGDEFTLPPETTRRYRLIDVTQDGALIVTPAGDKVRVPRLR